MMMENGRPGVRESMAQLMAIIANYDDTAGVGSLLKYVQEKCVDGDLDRQKVSSL